MNMRKIIAVLAAVLMLCTVIPMGAMSVTAAAVSIDFEDGTTGGWNSDCGVEVVDDNGNKVLKWDASLADWANMFNYCNLSANTDYVLTLKVKADRDTNMNFKVLQGDWQTVVFQSTFNVTTEWQEVTVEFNYGDGAFVMLSSNTVKADGATYYVDDFSIEEYVAPVVPGTIVNGDFETGDLSGWASHQGTVISTDAHSGSYAANIKGDGGWGGMLNQDVPVEAGKTYKVSVWYKVNSNGTNIQVKDGGTEGAKLASNWVTAATWTEQTWEVIPTTDIICFNFCGGGNGIAEDVLIDDITVTELKDPSFDGYIYNGDFEIGEGTPWTLYSGSNVSADAAYEGDYGVHCTNPSGGWGGTVFQDFTVEVGKTYEVTMWAKAISNGQNIQIQNPIGTTVASKWFTTTEWTLLTFTFAATDANVRINICGGGTGGNEEIYVDNIVVKELVVPSDVNLIENGDFETGDTSSWTNLWGSSTVELVAGNNSGYAIKGTANGNYNIVYQEVAVNANTNYTITVYSKDSTNSALWVKNAGGNGDIGSSAFNSGSDWTKMTYTFNSGANTSVWVGLMGISAGGTYTVDDISMFEKIDPSFDGYITNGDFETGDIYPWDNLWGSCPTAEIVEGGMDSDYALNIVSKKWCHVRQTAIAVEANTWYKVTAWAKNTSDMILLVKDGDDSANLNQTGMTAGDEWTEFTGYFNSGDYTTVIVSLMGGENDEVAEKYGTFDNISMEVTEEPGCEQGYHKYFYACDAYCMECGEETNPDAAHNVIHVEAKDPVSCIEYGNKEYWYCDACGTAWLDEGLIRQTNMMSVRVAGECVSDAEYACQDGVCVNCGLPYAADAEHEYDDEYDADCNVCGDVREVPEKPVEIIYGDANGDGIIDTLDEVLLSQYLAEWDVELDEAAADANGDGIIDTLDEVLLSQYLAEWDVTLGPV